MKPFSKFVLTISLAASAGATLAQQGASTNAPTQPTQRASSFSSKTGVGMLLLGAVGAGLTIWYDPRTEHIEDALKKARRKVSPPDSNGDVTTVEKDRNDRVVEKQKVDKNGAEKAFDSYRFEGEACVFEQHIEVHERGPNKGGRTHRVVHRHKDGSPWSDETDEYDAGGSQIGGTRTTVDADGKSTTETYDRETNRWR